MRAFCIAARRVADIDIDLRLWRSELRSERRDTQVMEPRKSH